MSTLTISYYWNDGVYISKTCIFNLNAFFILLGVGIGVVFGSLMLSYARNPSLKQQLFTYAILGFALTEAMGLMCIMVTFLVLFAF